MDLALPNQETQENTVFWPILGLKESVKRFWNRVPRNFQSGLLTFQSDFSRVGKKKNKPKQYHYSFSADHVLSYARKRGDKPKGFLLIDDTIVIRLSTFPIQGQKYLGIQLNKSDKVSILIFAEENTNALFEFWENLTPLCAMNNFDEMYQTVQLLGKGSFATVHKVRRYIDDQIFAAKMYFRETLNTNQHKDKFVVMVKNEINVLRKVQHPGIAALYEVYQQPDKVVLVTEYVQGPDLYQLLKCKKVIKERKASSLIQQIASVLDTMHNAGYVHRDIKLENILLQSFETYETKVVDFGFSESINEQLLTSKAGTPGYIPPELFTGLPYTAKGDIFSLGVMLYSLVGGYSPFKGRSYKAILESNKKGKIVFDKPVWKYVSKQCQDLILRMCDVNPLNRITAWDILNSSWIKGSLLPNDDQRLEISNFQHVNEDPYMGGGQNVPSFYQKSNVTLKSFNVDMDDDYELDEDNIFLEKEKIAQMQKAQRCFRVHQHQIKNRYTL